VTGGHLLSAAFNFLGELLPAPADSPESGAASALTAAFKESLAGLLEHDEQGRPRLTFVLPDAAALDALSGVLGRLLSQTKSA
jgi:hypothetical protein